MVVAQFLSLIRILNNIYAEIDKKKIRKKNYKKKLIKEARQQQCRPHFKHTEIVRKLFFLYVFFENICCCYVSSS